MPPNPRWGGAIRKGRHHHPCMFRRPPPGNRLRTLTFKLGASPEQSDSQKLVFYSPDYRNPSTRPSQSQSKCFAKRGISLHDFNPVVSNQMIKVYKHNA